MRFKRCSSWVREFNLIILLSLLPLLLLGLNRVFVDKDYELFIVSLAGFCILFFGSHVLILLLVKSVFGGSPNDYIVITDNDIELFTEKETVCIKWEDVSCYRRIKPIRGTQSSVIIDKYGKRISFASTNRLDKRIFAMRPELKEVSQECARDE